ncbi:MAG: hypothetical protein IJM76_04350 [Lachnospiraceae bacterium]|nr:hypothetical protein [Lachnospiraceae bacterium]
MSFSYDAVIFFSGDIIKTEQALRSLLKQDCPPGRTLLLCAEGEEAQLSFAAGTIEIVPLPVNDPGLFLAVGTRRTEAPYVLFLSGSCGRFPAALSARMFAHFSDDPSLEVVFTAGYDGKEDGDMAKAYDEALFSVCPVYGKEKLFSLGPQLFLRDLGAMLVKRELITDCPPEVGALTAPERLYAAHALYRDARVCCDPELRTAYSRHLSPTVLFRDMFCFGAALRLYYQSFGIGFRMHKKMRGTGFTDNPVLETSLGKAVGNAGRKAAGSLLKSGAFYKLPWLFLTVLSGRLGAALGNWYHRLPASVNRKLAGGRYF